MRHHLRTISAHHHTGEYSASAIDSRIAQTTYAPFVIWSDAPRRVARFGHTNQSINDARAGSDCPDYP